MRHHSLHFGILAVTCGLLANAAPAQSAAETWVSGTGVNSGSCPITAPCRSFNFAHAQTNADGTINVLSPGNFGAVTITKSISIVADGVEALIVGGGSIGAAIKVEAGASDMVSLRGLTIDLRGSANIGIEFLSGAALHVHKAVIRRSTDGIRFAPASGASELYVADSVIADTSQNGIRVQPTGSGGAKVMLDRVRVENTKEGVLFFGSTATGSITATVRDSVSAGNTDAGIVAFEGGSGTTTVIVDRSASLNNGSFGIITGGAGATILIGDSEVTGNGTGLAAGTGTIASYGTNKVDGNGSDGSPNSAIAMK